MGLRCCWYVIVIPRDFENRTVSFSSQTSYEQAAVDIDFMFILFAVFRFTNQCMVLLS